MTCPCHCDSDENPRLLVNQLSLVVNQLKFLRSIDCASQFLPHAFDRIFFQVLHQWNLHTKYNSTRRNA